MKTKHKSVKWMLNNMDKVREEDIAQYAVMNSEDSAMTKQANIENFISRLILHCIKESKEL